MGEDASARLTETVDAIYRTESRRVLATLIRLLGDFDLAEEALHDAFTAALERWGRDGTPAKPAGVARFGRPLQGHRQFAPARTVRRFAGGAGGATRAAGGWSPRDGTRDWKTTSCA